MCARECDEYSAPLKDIFITHIHTHRHTDFYKYMYIHVYTHTHTQRILIIFVVFVVNIVASRGNFDLTRNRAERAHVAVCGSVFFLLISHRLRASPTANTSPHTHAGKMSHMCIVRNIYIHIYIYIYINTIGCAYFNTDYFE